MPIWSRGAVSDVEVLARQLGAGRVLVASAIMAAPVPTSRLLGLDSATAARVTWIARMMAVRDGALGVGALAARRNSGAGWTWLLAGAASDALDSLVLVGAIRDGRLRGVRPAAFAMGAAGTAGFGAWAAARLRRSEGQTSSVS